MAAVKTSLQWLFIPTPNTPCFWRVCLICRIWAPLSNIYPDFLNLFLVYSNHSVFPFHSLPFCIWIWFLFVADQLLTQLSEYMEATYGDDVHNVNAAALRLSAYLLLSLFLPLYFFWCVFHSPLPLGFIKAISLLQYLCEKICDWAYCRQSEIDVRCLSNILTHSCLLGPSFLICLCSWRRSARQLSCRINDLDACAKNDIHLLATFLDTVLQQVQPYFIDFVYLLPVFYTSL